MDGLYGCRSNEGTHDQSITFTFDGQTHHTYLNLLSLVPLEKLQEAQNWALIWAPERQAVVLRSLFQADFAPRPLVASLLSVGA
jgi:hypothetical protein